MFIFDWTESPAATATAAEAELASWLDTHAGYLPPVLTPGELAKALPDEEDWVNEFGGVLSPASGIRASVLHELCVYIYLYPGDAPEPHRVCDACASVALYDDASAWDYAEDAAALASCREWVAAQGSLALVGAVTALGPHTCEACGQEGYDAPAIILTALA